VLDISTILILDWHPRQLMEKPHTCTTFRIERLEAMLEKPHGNNK
jgi:hypothetical protein